MSTVELGDNPVLFLKSLIGPSGNKAKLNEFVRQTAMTYHICLWRDPRWPNQVDKWKTVAKMMAGNISEGGPSESEGGDPNYISQGIYKAHFRSAYISRKGDTHYLVLGCLVNHQLFDPKELPGFEKLLAEYNEKVVRKYSSGREVVTIREFLDGKESL
jgi:hypothetical protein